MKAHDVAAARGPPFLEAMKPAVTKSFAHVCMKWYVAWVSAFGTCLTKYISDCHCKQHVIVILARLKVTSHPNMGQSLKKTCGMFLVSKTGHVVDYAYIDLF